MKAWANVRSNAAATMAGRRRGGNEGCTKYGSLARERMRGGKRRVSCDQNKQQPIIIADMRH